MGLAGRQKPVKRARNGVPIRINAAHRRLDVKLDDVEHARRMAEWKASPCKLTWKTLYKYIRSMKSMLRGDTPIPLRSTYERDPSDVSEELQRIFDELIHEIDAEARAENPVAK